MTLFRRLFTDLFGKEAAASQDRDEIILKESIQPTDFFLKEFEQWRMAGMHYGMLDHLKEQRATKIDHPQSEANFYDFNSDASNGFYFLSEDPWSNKDYSFLVHYFQEKLRENHYRLHHSRREVRQEKGELKSLERFYLKLPISSRKQKPYQQAWGNIIIEHRLHEERTQLVKLMAHVYSDRSFQEPRNFEGLFNLLFNRRS